MTYQPSVPEPPRSSMPRVRLHQIPPARHAEARALLLTAFERVRGRRPSLWELQAIAAVSCLETQYGRGWTGAGVGSNNMGAIQAAPGQPSFPWTDSNPDDSKYQQGFRVYPTPLDGWIDLVRHMSGPKPRPLTEAALLTGSAWNLADAMRRERYFGGWCPVAAKRYGSAVRVLPRGTPDTWSEATRACHAEAIPQHWALVDGYTRQIAQALGEEHAEGKGPAAGAGSCSSPSPEAHGTHGAADGSAGCSVECEVYGDCGPEECDK